MQFELQARYKEPRGPEPESFYSVEMKFLKAEGVLVILRESGKRYNLLGMSNAPAGNYEPRLVPAAAIAHEDYALIWRLLNLKHRQVQMQISFTN